MPHDPQSGSSRGLEDQQRERVACARLARIHSHHALWEGLAPHPWPEAIEEFGIGLAHRIANAIEHEAAGRRAWDAMPAIDFALPELPRTLVFNDELKVALKSNDDDLTMALRRAKRAIDDKDDEIITLKAKVAMLERQLGKRSEA